MMINTQLWRRRTIQCFLFLALNFGCLWVSSLLMGEEPRSDWYLALPRAPWTPPGWVFGATWTLIMLCFAVYQTVLSHKNRIDYMHYALILLLCAGWNAVFFQWHDIAWALAILLTLTISVSLLTWRNRHRQGKYNWLMLPFCIWTLLATSLNAYPLLFSATVE